MGKLADILSYLLILIIKAYQFFISPLLGNCCRFYPSCSTYASKAIHLHGIIYGSYLTLKRVLRCHPWHPGGIDHVPERHSK